MEPSWFKSDRSIGLTGELPIVVFLSIGVGNVTDGIQQSVMVKPLHPFKRGQLNRFQHQRCLPAQGKYYIFAKSKPVF